MDLDESLCTSWYSFSLLPSFLFSPLPLLSSPSSLPLLLCPFSLSFSLPLPLLLLSSSSFPPVSSCLSFSIPLFFFFSSSIYKFLEFGLTSFCRMFIRGDVVSFLKRHGGLEWNGRNVARIFHGLSSSKFPYEEWNRDPAWGCHKYVGEGEEEGEEVRGR